MMRLPCCAALALVLLPACQTAGSEVLGLAELAPLDYAVMVTGGAFLEQSDARPGQHVRGTFAGAGLREPITIEQVLAVLREGAVFRRVDGEPDAERRLQLLAMLGTEGGGDDARLRQLLQETRDRGYDWLLVVEQLQDGDIEFQGINSRWPLSLTFWLLIGLGALIPDHTFESRATLRVTLRDLQSGRVVHDPLLNAGPVDLSLVERGSLFGFVLSLVVPPFWVHDDEESLAESVRKVTRRRLLVQLARDLKSEATRQRLRGRSVATMDLVRVEGRVWLRIESRESLSQVRLRQGDAVFEGEAFEAFQRALLDSLQREAGRFRYEAAIALPLGPGPVQVLLGTIAGNVASATLEPEGGL